MTIQSIAQQMRPDLHLEAGAHQLSPPKDKDLLSPHHSEGVFADAVSDIVDSFNYHTSRRGRSRCKC